VFTQHASIQVLNPGVFISVIEDVFYNAAKWTKRNSRLPRFERCWSRENDSLLQQAPQTAAAMLTERMKCLCAQLHGIAKHELSHG
jgi:hypothetical protein